MQDKNLYSYFRERKQQYDEMPGDLLWHKIESGLETPSGSTGKTTFLKTLLIVLVAGSIGTAGFYYLTSPVTHDSERNAIAPAIERAVTQEVGVTTVIPETPLDSVKKKKAFSIITDKKVTISAPGATEAEQLEAEGPQEQKPAFMENVSLVTSPGKIRLESKEALTDTEFDNLVTGALKHYESQPKSILTIVATGHKTYREVIETGMRKQKLLVPTKFKVLESYIEFQPMGSVVKFDSANGVLVPFSGTIKKENMPETKVITFGERAVQDKDTITTSP